MLQRYALSDVPILVTPLPEDTYIFITCAAGHTIRVELSYDGVEYFNWAAGDVTADTRRSFYESGDKIIPASVRFTRAAGSGVGSFIGVA